MPVFRIGPADANWIRRLCIFPSHPGAGRGDHKDSVAAPGPSPPLPLISPGAGATTELLPMPGMSRSLLNSKESPRFFALAVALGLSWAHKGTRGSGALGCQTLVLPPPLPHTTHFRLHFRSHLPAPSPSQVTTPISWPPWPKDPAHLSSMHTANDSAIGNRSITLCYSLPVRRGARLRSSKLPQAQLRSIEGRVGVFE